MYFLTYRNMRGKTKTAKLPATPKKISIFTNSQAISGTDTLELVPPICITTLVTMIAINSMIAVTVKIPDLLLILAFPSLRESWQLHPSLMRLLRLQLQVILLIPYQVAKKMLMLQ